MSVATRKKKEEIVIPFLDKHNWDVASGYCCPNENVLAWRDMIKDLDIDRAAGIWDQQDEATLKAVHENLHKVSFVHGDLTDLEGPFDLLCLSNALEHFDRTGKSPLRNKVVEVVRPGGYVIDCSYGVPKSWNKLGETRTSWVQSLYQLPE